MSETVEVPRELAWQLVGLLSQELAPCAEPDCRISSNPARQLAECRQALYDAIKPGKAIRYQQMLRRIAIRLLAVVGLCTLLVGVFQRLGVPL